MVQSLSRRTFLKGLAVGATTIALPGSLWQTGLSQPSSLLAVVKAGPDTMEPTRDNDPNLQVVANIFDGLLRRDPSGKLLPALATSFERTDLDKWEFTLRQGVKFHNGNPFDAQDVKFSLERLKGDFSEFQSFGSAIKQVQILAPFKVQVITAGPVPFFANNLHQIFILDQESSATRSEAEIAQKPIGTGAYRFGQWVQGSFVDLEANPDYWDGAAAIKRVRHQVVQDDSTRLAALESGDAQLVQSLPVQFADRVRSNSTLKLVVRAGRQAIFFSPKVVDSPLADLRVRQALYYAIDTQAIIKTVLGGFGAPAAQVPDSPTVGFNPDIKRLSFDPQKARALLSEAGFPNGFDLTVDVTNDQFANDVEVGQAVAQFLSRVGIHAQVRARPSSLFFADVDAHKLDFFIVGWFDGAFDFGRTAKVLLVTDAYFNGSLYSNAQFDALIKQSDAIVNAQERAKLLQRANKLVMDDVALVPLYYEAQVWGTAGGLQFQPRSDSWTVYHDLSF